VIGLTDFGFVGSIPYHVGYAVRDLDDAMGAFGSLLELSWAPVSEGVDPGGGGGTIRWVFSQAGPVHVELFEGGPTTIWHTDRRAELHHLAYWCHDLHGAVESLAAEGWELQLSLFDDDGTPGQRGRATEFAYLARPGWPRLELVDSHRIPNFLALTCHVGPAAAAAHGAHGERQELHGAHGERQELPGVAR
jgi:hypothetical protein